MEVHIRLVRNDIKSSRSYGKYFAKTVSQGEVTRPAYQANRLSLPSCQPSPPRPPHQLQLQRGREDCLADRCQALADYRSQREDGTMAAPIQCAAIVLSE